MAGWLCDECDSIMVDYREQIAVLRLRVKLLESDAYENAMRNRRAIGLRHYHAKARAKARKKTGKVMDYSWMSA